MQFLGSNEKGMDVRAYIGWETPVARGGATDPLPRPGTSLQIQKKFTLDPVVRCLGDRTLSPQGRATGGIFENFQNGHIFLKFLFF